MENRGKVEIRQDLRTIKARRSPISMAAKDSPFPLVVVAMEEVKWG
jgi:hypothetical protein